MSLSSPTFSFDEPIASVVTQQAFQHYATGVTDPAARDLLQNTGVSSLFPNGVNHRTMASCCLSGIWLLHNFLDDSHEISQSIKTPEGSLWHGLMHRLEGDFWNSKYWYRQAGDHPCFERISELISETASVEVAQISMLGSDPFDPYGFVDLCEQAETGRDQHQLELARHISRLEWLALFEYCLENATK